MKNNQIIALFFAGLLLFTSCNKGYSINSASNILENTSSEDVFRSIFFMDGPLVEHLPILESKAELLSGFELDESMREDLRAVQDSFIQMIDENNPDFLASFKQTVMDNDPYQILEKIDEGSDLMAEVVEAQGLDYLLNDAKVSSILEDENINLEDYDFNEKKDIEKFYEDVSKVIDLSTLSESSDSEASKLALLSKSATGHNKCFVAFAIAVAVAFAAAAALAAVQVAGVYNVVYFVNAAIFVNVAVDEKSGSIGTTNMETNLLVSDLIKLN